MGKASRAIIIENGKILVMYRNKQGSQYYTLVGGRATDEETPEDALLREVKEETGLVITRARLVYVEYHQPPYNEQYIYLCEVASHDDISLQDTSEEAHLNKLNTNIHRPQWADKKSFATLPFRTPRLQEAIIKGIKKGFAKEAISL